MTGARELVSGYVRRVVDAAHVRAAVARALGVAGHDVVADDDDVPDPVSFVEVTPEDGEYPTRITAFVDIARAPSFTGKPKLLAALASALDSSVLYDDGASSVPYRWVRIDPDGARYEVFEDPAADALRLDPSQGARRLDDGAR